MSKWLWETFKNRKCGRPQNRSGNHYNQFGVLHTTENNLGASAKNVALWQNTQKKVYSGYHYLVDVDEVVYQCNPKTTKAQHAGLSYRFGGIMSGSSGIGVSMVARAGLMPYSSEKNMFKELIHNTANLLVDIEKEYGIPLKRITIEQYKQGIRGWLGHQDVAYRLNKLGQKKQRKFDPGARFPWDVLLAEAVSIKNSNKIPEHRKDTTMKDNSKSNHPSASSTTRVISTGDNYMELVEQELKSIAANPNSLKYLLRFYRAIYKGLDLDGSKPEDVAQAILDKIK